MVEHPYLILCVVLLAGVTAQTLNEQWSGDVYEHLAVVRELAARPFDPQHPLVAVDAEHPLFSPYTVTLGLFAKVTGLGAVSTLQVAAIANAVLLLVAYRRFARVVTRQPNAEFFGLLAVLLLWGPTAWRLSGFLNLGSIGYGLPYPSTFAIALMLFTLAEFDLTVRDGPTITRLTVLALGVAVILLTHPITGIATAAGMAGIWFGRRRVLPTRRDVPLLLALLVALALVTVWPYYSFWQLLVDNGDYTDAHFQLYEGLPLRLAPLVILAVLLVALRPKLRDEPLLMWGVIGTGLYVLGVISGQYVLGREIAFVALAVLTQVGVVVARYAADPRPGRERTLVIAAGLLAVVGLVVASPALLRMVPRGLLPGDLSTDDRLAPITADRDVFEAVPADAVVAAWPNAVSDQVPAFAGKVVATPKPVPFIDDARRREDAMRRLFSSSTSAAERAEIIDDEQVEYVVFDDQIVSREAATQLTQLGEIVASRGHLVVVEVAR